LCYNIFDERSIMRDGHYTTWSDLIFTVHFWLIIRTVLSVSFFVLTNSIFLIYWF
jgi:hypothetical protein